MRNLVMDEELFDMERELYSLKKERTNLLLKLPYRSPMRKMLPYIVWFLALSAVSFINHWAIWYFGREIPYEKFPYALGMIIFIDILRAARKAYIMKCAKEYSHKIKILEREIARRKIPE